MYNRRIHAVGGPRRLNPTWAACSESWSYCVLCGGSLMRRHPVHPDRLCCLFIFLLGLNLSLHRGSLSQTVQQCLQHRFMLWQTLIKLFFFRNLDQAGLLWMLIYNLASLGWLGATLTLSRLSEKMFPACRRKTSQICLQFLWLVPPTVHLIPTFKFWADSS